MYDIIYEGFEWSSSKEELNILKHGVNFTEASTCFSDPRGFGFDDLKHSDVERREWWIGMSERKRILITWFTPRGERIRIIGSASFRKFRRLYNERT
ncbi:MAG: BrnT family toxin [Deltaproteobacteria bacterium]|nr:BrnT family toxin [Deltaproteobacteria bacterium]